MLSLNQDNELVLSHIANTLSVTGRYAVLTDELVDQLNLPIEIKSALLATQSDPV